MPCDVLVVGAGPVGLTLAAELRRYGVATRLIEKAPERSDKSKAVVVWSRTMELMDRMGCAPAFLATGLKATVARIFFDGREWGHIGLEGVASPHPFALMLPQSETERLMAEHLGRLGGSVERGVELAGFTADPARVVAQLRLPGGREETVATQWLVGCDGAHSTVRHQLGMDFVGDTLMTDWVLADLEVPAEQARNEIEIHWHASGILAIFPITAGRIRIIADVGDTNALQPRAEPTLADIQALIAQRGPAGLQATTAIWLAAFHINERKVADYRAGRVFLAGDAAHVHSPAGGQGMNMGMQDACNLAWKLALVCRGECAPEPLLASFSAERSEIGRQVLKATGRLTRLAVLRGGIKQDLRNRVAGVLLGLKSVRARVADTITEVAMGYPDGPLNRGGDQPRTGPAPGERAPIRAGESPVGAGGEPRFALFADPGAESGSLAVEFAGLIEPTVRAPFGSGGIWLVRPDGYVAVATRRGRGEEVAAFLRGLLA